MALSQEVAPDLNLFASEKDEIKKQEQEEKVKSKKERLLVLVQIHLHAGVHDVVYVTTRE